MYCLLTRYLNQVKLQKRDEPDRHVVVLAPKLLLSLLTTWGVAAHGLCNVGICEDL